ARGARPSRPAPGRSTPRSGTSTPRPARTGRPRTSSAPARAGGRRRSGPRTCRGGRGCGGSRSGSRCRPPGSSASHARLPRLGLLAGGAVRPDAQQEVSQPVVAELAGGRGDGGVQLCPGRHQAGGARPECGDHVQAVRGCLRGLDGDAVAVEVQRRQVEGGRVAAETDAHALSSVRAYPAARMARATAWPPSSVVSTSRSARSRITSASAATWAGSGWDSASTVASSAAVAYQDAMSRAAAGVMSCLDGRMPARTLPSRVISGSGLYRGSRMGGSWPAARYNLATTSGRSATGTSTPESASQEISTSVFTALEGANRSSYWYGSV